MIPKTKIGLTCSLIGLLIPLLSTVCFASTNGNKPDFFGSHKLINNILTLQKDNNPENDLSIKQNVDFVYRIKNYRLFLGNDYFITGDKLSPARYIISFFTPFNTIPRPAYYNYLFMFKPFDDCFERD